MIEIALALLGSDLGKWLAGAALALAAYAGVTIKARRDGAAAERARQDDAARRAHETRQEINDDAARKGPDAVRDALAGWVSDDRTARR